MNKKILIFCGNLQSGGAERQMVYLAKALASQNEVSFLLFYKKGVFLNEIETLGITIQTTTRKNLWTTSRDLRKIILKNGYDIVVSYLPECNLISELSTFPIKRWNVVVGARNSDPKYVNNCKFRIYYYAHLIADCVISNSESNKRDILRVNKLVSKKKIKVVYNIFTSQSCLSTYIPFKIGKIHIAIAANFRFQKNLEGTLKALTLLKEEDRSKIIIDWYGLKVDDTFNNGIKIIKDYQLDQTIRLHPSTNKVLDIYNASDVVGLFSHYEGLPNSLCEALMIGKMVICTPVSDMPFLLKDTGNIVCYSDSAYDIKDGLEKLIKTHRDTIINIGKQNKEIFSSMFNKDNIEKQLLRLFSEIR